MGTRNLTMVIAKEEVKVAQYGQWDGGPEGQGSIVLEFLANYNKDKFTDQLSKISFFTQEEMNQLGSNWLENRPYLSRDLGAKILNAIHYGEFKNTSVYGSHTVKCSVDKLRDSRDFAGDSLMCEWAYVIDLDKNTFEVYGGFNKQPLDKNERFYSYPVDHAEYRQVKHVKTYPLIDLPTEEAFLAGFVEEEEEV